MSGISERQTQAINDYTAFLGERLTYPGLDYNSALTFLNYYFGFERSVLHLVHKDMISRTEERYILETPMAKGSISKSSHNHTVDKIAHKSLAALLNDLEPSYDSDLNHLAHEIQAEFSDHQPNTQSILIDVCINKQPKIADPKKTDMQAPYNQELFHLYSIDTDNLNPDDYKTFILIPLIGTDKKTFAIIGASKPFSTHPNLEHTLSQLETPSNLVKICLQNTKLKEINARRKGYAMARHSMLTAINAIVHEFRNPLVSIGGFTRLMDKKIKEDPTQPAESLSTYIKTIIQETEKAETAVNSFVEVMKKQQYEPDKLSLQTIIDDICMRNTDHPIIDITQETKPMIYANKDFITPILKDIFTTVYAHNGKNPIEISGRHYKLKKPKGIISEMYELHIYSPDLIVKGCDQNLQTCIQKNGNKREFQALLVAQKALELSQYGDLCLSRGPNNIGTKIKIALPVYPRTMPNESIHTEDLN